MEYNQIIKGNNNVSLKMLDIENCTQEYVDWLNNPEINRYLEARWQTHTLESTIAFVKSIKKSPDSIIFAIIYKNKYVGNIKIGPIHPIYKHADVGYMIGDKSVWGNGVATNAINSVCKFAFNVLKLERMQACVFEENIGSQKALLKNNFKLEGRYRKKAFLKMGDNYSDIVTFSLLKSEYKEL